MTRHDTPLERPLTGAAVANIVKRYAAKGGLDAANVGAHSLRAGFVTNQFNHGTPAPVIMGLTGHRYERVLNGYYRKAKRFERKRERFVRQFAHFV